MIHSTLWCHFTHMVLVQAQSVRVDLAGSVVCVYGTMGGWREGEAGPDKNLGVVRYVGRSPDAGSGLDLTGWGGSGRLGGLILQKDMQHQAGQRG